MSIPRPEYPRPQMVRSDWVNLNGQWEFQLDSSLSGEEKGFHLNAPFDRMINVPFCPESELSGIGEKDFMPCVWYKRSLTIPDDWNGKRIVLHFGAADYDTTVWVNGKQAGFHRGGYSPFSFEITDLLDSGDNTIVVRCVDDTRSNLQPTGKQSTRLESYACLYTRTTGIWQTVWVEAVPETYLKSFRIYPDVDKGNVTVRANIDGPSEGSRLIAKATADGEVVGEAEVSAEGNVAFTIELLKRYLWEPENPFLYDLEFVLMQNGDQIDRVDSYFGLRKVHIEGKKVLINNKPVFQRLVLDQGFYPDGIYTAPSDDALRNDIEISLTVGFNGARLHQKVFEPRFLYWADRLGYLVWGEFADWGIDRSKPELLERILSEWLEVLERDFNHPSIIGWCPFNETDQSQNPELLRSIYKVTKAVDQTRPVIDTSGYVHVETDIYDCHNYTQDPQAFASTYEPFKSDDQNVWTNLPGIDCPYKGQPYFVSEYGGIWWNPEQVDEKSWGYGDRPKSEEEFIERYRGLTEALLFHPKMFGFCYTQLYDIELEVNGLYTYDRKPKFDSEIFKAINSQRAAIERD